MRDSGRVDYGLLLGEGIDNALDAGATEIKIHISDHQVSFRDNGSGITRDRVSSILTMGLHGAMTTSRLGRFGVGIKIQALRTGDIFDVSSISKDGRMQAHVSWPTLLRSQRWEIPDPRWRPVVAGTQTGTEIVVSELRDAPKVSLGKLRDSIALRFHPALAAGVEIIVNNCRIEIFPEPAMDNVVEQNFQWPTGCSAVLRGGILTGASQLKRVHVGFRHRVIMPTSGLGCGMYSGIDKIFARVQLTGPWHIGQFKDDLPDDKQRQELDDAIHPVLRPLLERCQTRALTARLEKVTEEINNLLPIELARRPRRQKEASSSGSVKRPRRSGNVDAAKSDAANSPAKSRKPAAGLLITFDGDMEEDGIVAVDLSARPHRVNLCKDHPDIKRLLDARDDLFGIKQLYFIAMQAYQYAVDIHPDRKQYELPFIDGLNYGQKIARLLAAQDVEISIVA